MASGSAARSPNRPREFGSLRARRKLRSSTTSQRLHLVWVSPTSQPTVPTRTFVETGLSDRPEALSIQEGCSVIARRGPVLLTDSEAVPGISGAPVVREGVAGPELVGVVSTSAGADPLGRGQAIAVAIDAHLPHLMGQIGR